MHHACFILLSITNMMECWYPSIILLRINSEMLNTCSLYAYCIVLFPFTITDVGPISIPRICTWPNIIGSAVYPPWAIYAWSFLWKYKVTNIEAMRLQSHWWFWHRTCLPTVYFKLLFIWATCETSELRIFFLRRNPVLKIHLSNVWYQTDWVLLNCRNLLDVLLNIETIVLDTWYSMARDSFYHISPLVQSRIGLRAQTYRHMRVAILTRGCISSYVTHMADRTLESLSQPVKLSFRTLFLDRSEKKLTSNRPTDMES